jgi:hypothetical protein
MERLESKKLTLWSFARWFRQECVDLLAMGGDIPHAVLSRQVPADQTI